MMSLSYYVKHTVYCACPIFVQFCISSVFVMICARCNLFYGVKRIQESTTRNLLMELLEFTRFMRWLWHSTSRLSTFGPSQLACRLL